MRLRLILSFVFVTLISIASVALIARRSTAREVQAFMYRGSMTQVDTLAKNLEAYYRASGSWQGVESFLLPGAGNRRGMGGMGLAGQGMAAMMNTRLRLADEDGQVLVDTKGASLAATLSSVEQRTAQPLRASGRRVGYLLVETGRGMTGDAGSFLLNRLNRAALIAAGIAGGIALVLALLLADRLILPVRQLTQAAARLAKGDLVHRVPIKGNDELAELGQAFNHMADSLQQAEENRREMTADIAHELRTPLSVQRAHLEALQDGIFPPTPENLQPVIEQNLLLTRLVEDLRTLALADAW
jgi:two-component system OmpR family sensor kinase/two-component system sensor histidine kinase BaeS